MVYKTTDPLSNPAGIYGIWELVEVKVTAKGKKAEQVTLLEYGKQLKFKDNLVQVLMELKESGSIEVHFSLKSAKDGKVRGCPVESKATFNKVADDDYEVDVVGAKNEVKYATN